MKDEGGRMKEKSNAPSGVDGPPLHTSSLGLHPSLPPCPDCGASPADRHIAAHCWLCGRKTRDAEAPGLTSAGVALPLPGTRPPSSPTSTASAAGNAREGEAPAEPLARTTEPGSWTFSLSSLMLVMTLIAVTLGVGAQEPGLGFAFALLVAPAAIRTSVAAARRRRAGTGMGVTEKLWAFAASLGIVLATAVSGGAAFYATCWAGFFGGALASEPFVSGYDGIVWGLGAGVILGVIVGLYVTYRMIRWLWPLNKAK